MVAYFLSLATEKENDKESDGDKLERATRKLLEIFRFYNFRRIDGTDDQDYADQHTHVRIVVKIGSRIDFYIRCQDNGQGWDRIAKVTTELKAIKMDSIPEELYAFLKTKTATT